MQRRVPRPRRALHGRLRAAAVFGAFTLLWAAAPIGAASDDPIERLESEGRAKPDVTADEIERLLSAGPIEGYARLDVQSLLGNLRARLHQPAAAEAVAQALQKPGAPGYQKVPADQLNAAAACIRAQVALNDGGSLARADAQLTEVENALRGITAVRVRMRCLSTAASIKQRIGRIDEAVRISQEVIRLADESGVAWRRSSYRSSLAYTLYRGGQAEPAARVNEEAKKIGTEA